jgi:arylsulfatase A-like enzyme
MDVASYAARERGVDRSETYYETPNIDRLADEGIAFSHAYVNQLCSPTRASLLTGKYAARLGFTTATPGTAKTYYNQGVKPPFNFHEQDVLVHKDKIKEEQALFNGRSRIALASGQPQDKGKDEITIAEALNDYHSAFIGKWHVGGHGSEGYQPWDQGFETLGYYDAGASSYFNWRGRWDRRKLAFPKMRQKELLMGTSGLDTGEEYLTDDLTQQALIYLDKRAKVKDEPFFLYFCHFAVHAPIQGREDYIDHFEKKSTKGFSGHDNATYAAMVKSLDDSVGAIVGKLRDTGLEDNTIVIFLSDNGGVDWAAPTIVPTSNAPFKGGKATLFEGGVRVPLIVWAPGRIKGDRLCHISVHCNDIFPTIMELAGYKVKHEIDGQSIVPLFDDLENQKKNYTRDTFYWHYPFNVIVKHPDTNLPLTPHSAVRAGDYKLIFDWHGKLSLYNIKEDPYENNDLSEQMPEKLKKMFGQLSRWLDENVEPRYYPRFNTNYDPAKDTRDYPFRDMRKEMLGLPGISEIAVKVQSRSEK